MCKLPQVVRRFTETVAKKDILEYICNIKSYICFTSGGISIYFKSMHLILKPTF